jgi:hypothetical protein
MELLIKQYAPDDLENPDGVGPRSYEWPIFAAVALVELCPLKLPMLIVTGEGLCSIPTHLGCP